MDYIWLFTVAGGALILGLVLAYALLKRREPTEREAARRDAKIRDLYHGEEEEASSPVHSIKVAFSSTKTRDIHQRKPAASPEPGTVDERPRWEGPQENRPRGYRPASDDPHHDADAAGETVSHHSRNK